MNVDFHNLVQKIASCWNVNATFVFFDKKTIPSYDLGLRDRILQDPQTSLRALLKSQAFRKEIEPAFFLFDCFKNAYYLLWLPKEEREAGDVLVIGPYLYKEKKASELLQICDVLNLPNSLHQDLFSFDSQLPVITAIDPWHKFLENLYVWVYPSTASPCYSLQTYFSNHLFGTPLLRSRPGSRIQITNYSINEQEIIAAVAMGNNAKAIEHFSQAQLFSASSPLSYPEQLAWANTCLSWGANIGEVHEKVINLQSQQFASAFLAIKTLQDRDSLLREMILTYCNLVNQYSLRKTSSLIQSVSAELCDNLSEAFSLQDLAQKYSVNPSYLSARFKQERGISLLQFLLFERIKYARRLFDAGNTSVQDVATKCGIYDISYFRKCFRKETGMSPSDYLDKNAHSDRALE